MRLALAETRIIQETKEFLDKEGINVDAFNSKQRSDNTILVKNIPYGTTVDEIREMFSAHGDVGRVLMPPAGTIAVVEFPVAGEARTAFRALAYKRIKNSILYLEKAPADVFKPKKTATAPPADEKVAPVTAAAGKPAPASKSTLLGAGDGSEAEVEPGATLFVKNLSFATTDVRLGEVFGALSDYAFARVQTKPDTKNANNRLSMGYGFVGFRNVGAAQKALKAMDGFVLDGHTLAVKFAKRGHDSDDKAARGGVQAPSAKMIVKNLPFEATKRDVRELFGYVSITLAEYFCCVRRFHLLTHPCHICFSFALSQCPRPTEIRPSAQKIRPKNPRIRIHRIRFSSGGRECIFGAQTHPFTRSSSRLAMERRGGSGCGCGKGENQDGTWVRARGRRGVAG